MRLAFGDTFDFGRMDTVEFIFVMAFCRSNLSAIASSSWHSASGFWIFPGNVPSDEPEVDFELFSHLSGTLLWPTPLTGPTNFLGVYSVSSE